MPPERNAPCPCGSGKKYKKCCGTAADVTKPDNISLNRLIAYKGQVGRQREQFCLSYTAQKKAGIAAIEDRLRQNLADNNKTSSCTRGCNHCCRLFVTASLQECEVIVHYLYNHEDALTHFLRSFDTWKNRISRITRRFQAINDLHQKITAGQATAEDQQQFDKECGLYAQADIPCPFLKDNACSVYEVRPYTCASIISVSSAEWCSPDHPRHPEALYLKSSLQTDGRPPYLALPATCEILASMPSLIYDILHDGYALLDTIPGLEGIKSRVWADPEVQAILNNRGYSSLAGNYAK